MYAGGFGISLLLVAAGAVLAWAVDVNTEGVNLNTVGVILFVIGLIGLLVSLIGAAVGGRLIEREREVVVRDDHHTHR